MAIFNSYVSLPEGISKHPISIGIFIGNPLPFPWDQVLDGVEV